MRVLITGSGGFLGRRFLQHHIEAGNDVYAIDDLSSAGSYWLPGDNYARITNDAVWVLPFFDEQFDFVYHFAAPVGGRQKIEGDPLYNADSLRIDSAVFRWAVTHAKTLVYPSSSAVYPISLQGNDGHQLQEGMFSARNPNWLAPDEMYGFTKLVGERLALAAEKYGLNTLCIRPFSGYGEGQSMDYPVPSIAKRAIDREDPITIWGPGTQRRDFVHVDDIVGATVARVAAGVEGYQTMNIGSGYGLTFDDIARLCAEIVGYEPVIEHDLSKPVGVMARFADNQKMANVYGAPKVRIREGLTRVLDSLR